MLMPRQNGSRMRASPVLLNVSLNENIRQSNKQNFVAKLKPQKQESFLNEEVKDFAISSVAWLCLLKFFCFPSVQNYARRFDLGKSKENNSKNIAWDSCGQDAKACNKPVHAFVRHLELGQTRQNIKESRSLWLTITPLVFSGFSKFKLQWFADMDTRSRNENKTCTSVLSIFSSQPCFREWS